MNTIFKTSFITLSLLIVVLTFSCIFQIINTTQEKHLVQRYQREINKLSGESYFANQKMENRLTLSEVEEMARERSFTESENITYVRVSSSEVVVVR